MTAKPRLGDVTICAADCLNPGLAARALACSALECEFADSILFTDAEVDGPFRRIPIPALGSREDYSRFVLRDLHRHVETPFALIVQWDGYVIDGGAWSDRFLDYDYIGAKWPWHESMRVGNGGFSLRSRRLLQIAAELPDPTETLNEDEIICRFYRTMLEHEYRILFATEEIADQFSREHRGEDFPTFGFHGAFNMWRLVPEEELEDLITRLDDRSIRDDASVLCALACWTHKRFKPFAILYRRWRETMTVGEVRRLVEPFFGEGGATPAFLKAGEAIIKGRPTAKMRLGQMTSWARRLRTPLAALRGTPRP